ncbi:Spy/CpxP family protein refolding chaperone [Fodinicurvata fenggangensis]|uniref:Spy/CpxP family protein refolding chaperone n=1 Tax=Fodinicurvata fenggangensis TaxID=1121830 RepID=UPI001B80129D|nr:Spy/CpxP family protein refolding chaperone [Fodinicurvata fenggangensis]
MRVPVIMTAACLFLVAAPAWAETSQPYSGLQEREIKALSQEELADLQAGRGMGFALAAELNGYPGPLHVLELARQLDLTSEQEARVQALYDSMKDAAEEQGARLVELEAKLDRKFAEQSITSESLQALTAEIGQARAALRATHLKSHLTTRDLLSAEQIAAYAELRGYQPGEGQEGEGHHHGGHGN